MSARVAETKLGYKNVKVFHAGMPAWLKAGNVAFTTQDFVSKRLAYLVVIDTRGEMTAKQGHIQGAVAIPLEAVVAEKNQFPLDRKAYIVLYGQETEYDKIGPVIKDILSWGYKRVYLLQGGYSAWAKNNKPIMKDLVRTKIFYLPRPHPGEITGDEFMNIVDGKPEDKMVLDVRTQAEAAAGMLPNAVNIPVDELNGRLSELPENKEIITHCRTGLRAEMGYTILRNAGYNARFLNDKVTVLQDSVFCCYK
jgi:rhodanese-related sulfurtransferase